MMNDMAAAVLFCTRERIIIIVITSVVISGTRLGSDHTYFYNHLVCIRTYVAI